MKEQAKAAERREREGNKTKEGEKDAEYNGGTQECQGKWIIRDRAW